MRIEGRYSVRSSAERLWGFITDPHKFAKCLPDVESVEVKDERNFEVDVNVGLAFLRGRFRFHFTLLEAKMPWYARFTGKGRGAGVSVELNATVQLRDLEGGVTEVEWKANVVTGGLLGELSPTLVEGTAKRFTADLFERIKAAVEAESSAAPMG